MNSLKTRVNSVERSTERNVQRTRLEDEADLKRYYSIGRKLGEGGFGIVCEATDVETKEKWAVKKVNKDKPGSSGIKLLEREVTVLNCVQHPHIIQLKEVFETPKSTYMVLELCEGGDLNKLLKQVQHFSEEECRHIIRSLADAMVHLHRQNIVHRDLKLENILVKNNHHDNDDHMVNIKVIDFGLATQRDGFTDRMQASCGTPMFMAPEVLKGRQYSQLCDLWSIGVIMYMLLSGDPPFVCGSEGELLETIQNGSLDFSAAVWETISDSAKNVLTRLLKVDPAHRITASELLDHPWITGDTSVNASPLNVLELMERYQETSDEENISSLFPGCSQDSEVKTDTSSESPPVVTETKVRNSQQQRSPSAKKPRQMKACSVAVRTDIPAVPTSLRVQSQPGNQVTSVTAGRNRASSSRSAGMNTTP